MALKKGKNNFIKYQSEVQKVNEILIRTELNSLANKRFYFKDLKDLVFHITEVTNIHRVTLNRNLTYRKLLLSFMVRQPGAICDPTLESDDIDFIKARTVSLSLEKSNLKSDNQKLKKSLEKYLSESTKNVVEIEKNYSTMDDWYLAFVNTAKILNNVLTRINKFGDTFVVDTNSGQIIDIAASPNEKLVSEGKSAEAYINYVRRLSKQEK